MNVLLISQFFPPDVAAVGVLLGDLAYALAEQEIAVRVICGPGGYGGAPEWQSYQTNSTPNLSIDLVRTARFTHTRIGKVASYLSFYAGALVKAIWGVRPDIVVTLTAPPGLAWIGWLLQRCRNVRHVVWEMDLYPDIAVDLGMTKVGALGWLFDFPRKRADAVIALGECMRSRLLGHNVAADRIRVCENWADGGEVRPSANWPNPRPIRLLYSGNLGLAHDVDTIYGVAQRLQNESGVEFVFAGGGPQRRQMENACKGFQNVTFQGWADKTDLGETLAAAHIGLVTQKSETVGSVVPSKVYGLMAAGRPVLYIGPASATPARVIRKHACGWHYDCGDVDGVVALLKHLMDRPDLIREAGVRARHALETEYDRPIGVRRVMAAVLGDYAAIH